MNLYARYKFTILFVAILLLLGIRLAASASRNAEILLDAAGAFLFVVAIVTLCADHAAWPVWKRSVASSIWRCSSLG